jgi:methylmalonyl-CoA mutase N-terminal domain/subunit
MRMFAGFGRPEDTNARFKYLLEQGQTGLSTAFDMPALMGYDADHVLARGEVGREGVAVSTLKDFEVLYEGIPLDRYCDEHRLPVRRRRARRRERASCEVSRDWPHADG